MHPSLHRITGRRGRAGRPLRAAAALGLVLALLLAPAFAATASGEAGRPPLRLQEAVSSALERNIDRQIATLTLENARIDHQRTLAANLITGSVYTQLQADFALRRAENTYRSTVANLTIDVVRRYFDLQQAERNLTLRRRQLEVAEENMRLVQRRAELGDAGAIDLMRERNRVEAARLTYLGAENAYRERVESFRQVTGLGGDAVPLLVDAPALAPVPYALDEAVALAREASVELFERDTNLQLARMDLEKLRVENTSPLDLRKAENSVRLAELQLTKAESSVQSSVVSAYHTLVQAFKRAENAVADYRLQAQNTEITRQQHAAGLRTDLQLQSDQNDLLSAEQSMWDAIHAYYVSLLQFRHTLGVDGLIAEGDVTDGR